MHVTDKHLPTYYGCSCCELGGQRTTLQSQFSPATLWDMGIKFKSTGLACKGCPHGAISRAPLGHNHTTGVTDLLVDTLSPKAFFVPWITFSQLFCVIIIILLHPRFCPSMRRTPKPRNRVCHWLCLMWVCPSRSSAVFGGRACWQVVRP